MNYDLSHWILGFLTFIWTIATPLFFVGGGAIWTFGRSTATMRQWQMGKSKAIVIRSSCSG